MTPAHVLAVWDADNTSTAIVGVIGLLAAVIGFAGVCTTLLFQGWRAERTRLRELYAGGWAAVQAYKEFAFVVRRRDHRDRAGERVRISEDLSAVQRELAYYEALIARGRTTRTAATYGELVRETRKVAGGLIRASWDADPIAADREMHAPGIATKLQELKRYEDRYLVAFRTETAGLWGAKEEEPETEEPTDSSRSTPVRAGGDA